MTDHIARMADAGADVVVMAAPATFMNAVPNRVVALFTDVVNASPLPMAIYDLGAHRPVMSPVDRLHEVHALPNVVMVKDSSGAPARRAEAIAAREWNQALEPSSTATSFVASSTWRRATLAACSGERWR